MVNDCSITMICIDYEETSRLHVLVSLLKFRLRAQRIVATDLLDQTGTICLDNFQLNQSFAQWSCPTQHLFRFDCMPNV